MRPSTILGTLTALLALVALGIWGAPAVVANDGVDAPIEVPETPVEVVVTTIEDVVDPDDGLTSLREAVDEAVASGVDTTIRLIPGVAHRLECGADDDANLTGDLDIAGTATIVLDGAGGSIEAVFGLCEPERLVDVTSTATLVLHDLVIDGSNGVGDGGAVRAHHLSLIDSVIRSSTAIGGRGGAAFVRGDLVVVDSELSDNRSLANGVVPGGSGGAAHVRGDVLVQASVISGNVAAYEGGGLAVATNGHALLIDSRFEGNSTQFGRGGALFAGADALVDIDGSSFASNSAGSTQTGGGAVFVDGHLRVTDSFFTDNEAHSIDIAPGLWNGGSGGALYSEGELDVERSVFERNTAGEVGAGGAVHHKGPARVSDSTFASNVAGGAGGGLYLTGGNDGAQSVTVNEIDVRDSSSGGSGGGGMFVSSTGPIVIVDSRFSGNESLHTDADGGGILVRGRALISRTTVDGNAVGHRGTGGGIHVDEAAQVTIENSVITGNRAASGGGVDGDAGPGGFVVLRHSTITDNHAPAGSQLTVRSLLRVGASIIGLGTTAEPDADSPVAGVPRGESCLLTQSPVSAGHNVVDDTSCQLRTADDAVADAPLSATVGELGRHLVLRPLTDEALASVPEELCSLALVDVVGSPRPAVCDAGAVETSAHLVVNDDVIRVAPSSSVEFDLLDNDLVGPTVGRIRFHDLTSPQGLLVSGSAGALRVETLLGAESGVIGRYEVCTASGERCDDGLITVLVQDDPPPTSNPTTTTPSTTEPPSTTEAPTSTTTPDEEPEVRRWSFGYTDVDGWTLDDGGAFDGDFGWRLPDGVARQCGIRGASADPVLDGFCHAVTRYQRIDGIWRSFASPASWSAIVPDGSYQVTVTVGDAAAHFGEAHSVQVEGVIAHERVVTSAAAPFSTATVMVSVTDGALDVEFLGGTRTKIVALELTPLDGDGGDGDGSTTTTTTTTSTTEPPSTTMPTTVPTTAAPSTTEQPGDGSDDGADVVRWSFGYRQVQGWQRDAGEAFDGEFGWNATDGSRRQCGVRGFASDPVLDGFCHATARYERQRGVWQTFASPASWSAALLDGTYEVAVTVGDATAHHGEVHSVQVDGVVVHDRVATSTAVPFATSTVTVEVTDGRLDVTFDGGTRTKIVAIEATRIDSEVDPGPSQLLG